MLGRSENQTLCVQLITRHQRLIYAYIRTLVADPAAADDILQETNLALWKNARRFKPDVNFPAYATRVARNKVIDHVRSGKKLGGLIYNTELAERIAARMSSAPDASQARLHALELCLGKLPGEARKLISRRYGKRESVRDLAAEHGRSESALQNQFQRLRGILRGCVEKTLAAETPT